MFHWTINEILCNLTFGGGQETFQSRALYSISAHTIQSIYYITQVMKLCCNTNVDTRLSVC